KKPYVGIESTVAIAGEKLVVGSGSGKVFILNKYTGRLISEFDTGDDTDGSPVIDLADSSFYIGVEKDFSENPGGLHKISLAGEPLWFYETGRKGIFSTAAIDSKRVIITGDDGFLYSLDKQSGELQWKTRLLDGSWSSPILINGRILTADYAGYLYGVDANNGKILWKKKMANYIVASPVLWEGIIIVGARDGFVYALK
ncbi:MAG: PQQ-binding-like beta-propeller repeat protein, partial [bacterium]